MFCVSGPRARQSTLWWALSWSSLSSQNWTVSALQSLYTPSFLFTQDTGWILTSICQLVLYFVRWFVWWWQYTHYLFYCWRVVVWGKERNSFHAHCETVFRIIILLSKKMIIWKGMHFPSLSKWILLAAVSWNSLSNFLYCSKLKFSVSFSHSLFLSYSYTHAHTHMHARTHARTHAHTHTHTHTHNCKWVLYTTASWNSLFIFVTNSLYWNSLLFLLLSLSLSQTDAHAHNALAIIHSHDCIHANTHTHMHTCTHACTHMHMHTHTHAHMHPPSHPPTHPHSIHTHNTTQHNTTQHNTTQHTYTHTHTLH